MINDAYYTVLKLTHGEYRDRGSKFFATAFPVTNIQSVKYHISQLRKVNPKCTHICSAYIIRDKYEKIEKAIDDGEPSGSAGLPILNAIKSKNLQNVLVCVVRYYGGNKLGIPGLIKAYNSSTSHALAKAEILVKHATTSYEIIFEYERLGIIMSLLKAAKLDIISKDFDEKPKLLVSIKSKISREVIYQLKRKILGLPSDYKDEIKQINGLIINELHD